MAEVLLERLLLYQMYHYQFLIVWRRYWNLWLAVTISNTLSPLKSPTATESGANPATRKVVAVDQTYHYHFLIVWRRYGNLALAVAISNTLSPLKSPTATEFG